MKTYLVDVESDQGIKRLRVKAMAKEIASLMVQMFEKCPPCAIIKIQAL